MSVNFLQAQIASNILDYEIKFFIRNAGIEVDGTIGELAPEIKIDLNNPANSSIKASAPISTLNSGIKSRDEHLMKKDYFDQANYPTITFKSVSLKEGDGQKWIGNFQVSIKGQTRSFAFPVTYRKDGDKLAIKGTFNLNRRDFGVGGGSIILSDKVRVELRATLAIEAEEGTG